MMEESGIEFPLVEAPGESVPLPDAAFDLAVSEYGASLWADPQKWIPEAARLLRPGGRLVFLTNSTLVYLCAPVDVDAMVGKRLMRDQFGMYRIQWDGRDRYRVPPLARRLDRAPARERLRDRGTARAAAAPRGAVDPNYYDYVTVDWARKWPAEEIWVAHKM